MVKVKHRRIMRHMTLGSHSVSLSSLKLINDLGEEAAGRRWVGKVGVGGCEGVSFEGV